MTPPKVNQIISLERVQADQLDALAIRDKTTKQALLRSAVDDLLAINGMGRSLTVEILRDALRRSSELIEKLEPLIKREALWKRKCFDAKLAIRDAQVELGVTVHD